MTYFFDFEVLNNLTTLAVLDMNQKKVTIGYNTHIEASRINKTHALTDITDLFEDKDVLIESIKKQNKNEYEMYDIKETVLTNDLLKTCMELTALAGKKTEDGFTNVVGFNIRGYDLVILATILGSAKHKTHDFKTIEEGLNAIDVSSDIISTNDLRRINDMLIGEKKSPYGGKDALFSEGQDLMTRWFYLLVRNENFLDMMRLNESSGGRNALKRIVAQNGGKILTSNALASDGVIIDNKTLLSDFLAYNVSDNFGAYNVFLDEKGYQLPLQIKENLYTRFKASKFKYVPKITRDATNSTLIESIIAPKKPLIDDDKLTLLYPVTRNYLFSVYKKQILDGFIKDSWITTDLKHYEEKLTRFFIDSLLKQEPQLTDNQIKTAIKELCIKKPVYAPLFFENIEYLNENGISSRDWYEVIDKKIVFKYNSVKSMECLYNVFLTTLSSHNIHINEPSEVRRSEMLNTYFEKWLETLPSHHIFNLLYKSPVTNHPRIGIKNEKIQLDLLESLEERFEEIGDARFDYAKETGRSLVYEYYHGFRGVNLEDKRERKRIANTPLYKKYNMSDGVVITFKNTSSYITMAIGGAHGNQINKENYITDQKQVYSTWQSQTKRQTLIQYYQDFFKTRHAKDTLKTLKLNYLGKNTKLKQLVTSWIEDRGAVLSLEEVEQLIQWLVLYYKKGAPRAFNEPLSIFSIYSDEVFIKGAFAASTQKLTGFKKLPKRKLAKDYSQTVYCKNAIHLDIASYYPTLIILLELLKTDDGVDEYHNLLKERLEVKAKIPHTPKSTWEAVHFYYEQVQLANKLLLNSASGKMDEAYKNNIKLNNKALRMRIAGQLILLDFCLTADLNNITAASSNTDGVYCYDITLNQAQALIEDWTSMYQLGADPEVIDLLISKDTNNRIEYVNGEVVAANGGEVGTYFGPTLTKSVSKPIITAKILGDYFKEVENVLTKPFLRDTVKRLLKEMIDEHKQLLYEDPRNGEVFKWYQHIGVSNPNKHNYIIMLDQKGQAHYTGSINRYFYVTKDAPFNTVRLINIQQGKTKKQNNEKALMYLKEANVPKEELSDKYNTDFVKNAMLDTYTFIKNNEDTKFIDSNVLDYLDLEAYTDIIERGFNTYAKDVIEIINDVGEVYE